MTSIASRSPRGRTRRRPFGWLSPRSIDVPTTIFGLVLALLLYGLIGVYSASASKAGDDARARAVRDGADLTEVGHFSAHFLKRQLMWTVLGLGAMAFFARLDYRKLKVESAWIVGACFLLCCMVWIPGVGVFSNGAYRWLRAGSLTLQPSEFAKLGLIVYMAKMLDERHHCITSFFSGVMPALIVTGAFALIIVLEPDFGAAFVLCSIVFGMWICGQMSWLHLGGLVGAGLPAAAMAILLKDFRLRRIASFFSDDPADLMDGGFQLLQSKIAIGSGGLFGVGLGNSMQKYQYLSEAHTDFIFAILAEEMGFFRVSIMIGLFAALVALGWWIALNTSDLFGSLLATGITLMVFLGAALNMGVALGLLPTTGLVLPFVSYGGSSLLVMMASMGILMNIARRQFTLTAHRSAAG